MVRIIAIIGLLALSACAGAPDDSSQSHPVRGLYGSFNGGGNAM